MAIELPDLPYAVDALEPQISKQTMEFHYGKHHQNYINTLNKLIQGTEYAAKSLDEIMMSSFVKDPEIYNNAAQAWNHSFFWNCMDDSPAAPSTELIKTLEENFGSFEEFKTEFETKAKELFGSGWTWLVKDRHNNLKIISLSNAGNPLAEHNETPLLVCDVWEHAYYLDYQNERIKFLENFWQVVDWSFVEAGLENQLKMPALKKLVKSRSAPRPQQPGF